MVQDEGDYLRTEVLPVGRWLWAALHLQVHHQVAPSKSRTSDILKNMLTNRTYQRLEGGYPCQGGVGVIHIPCRRALQWWPPDVSSRVIRTRVPNASRVMVTWDLPVNSHIRLWKHYLLASSLAGGNKMCILWDVPTTIWRSAHKFDWNSQATSVRCSNTRYCHFKWLWYWLVTRRVIFMVTFNFLPKILQGSGDNQMLLCHSLTAGWVVGTIEVAGILKPYLLLLKKMSSLHSQLVLTLWFYFTHELLTLDIRNQCSDCVFVTIWGFHLR